MTSKNEILNAKHFKRGIAYQNAVESLGQDCRSRLFVSIACTLEQGE